MAITSLIFGKKEKPKIGVLELDCNISESHEFENQVTAFPIENGSEITDHVINKPKKITVNGFVTNSPINSLGKIGEIKDAIAGNSGLSQKRVSVAEYELQSILFNKELVTIVTSLDVYDDMVMTSLSIPKDSKTGDALRFTATFQQIIKITTQNVPIENVKESVENKAQSPVPNGKQAGALPTEAAVSKASIAVTGFIKVGILKPLVK
jgi:D-ribose pyranose/furanose isomerase RbsD